MMYSSFRVVSKALHNRIPKRTHTHFPRFGTTTKRKMKNKNGKSSFVAGIESLFCSSSSLWNLLISIDDKSIK